MLVAEEWKLVADGTGTTFSGIAEAMVADLKASKVRVTIKEASDTPVIAEIRVFGK